jgi:hypothetical protein
MVYAHKTQTSNPTLAFRAGARCVSSGLRTAELAPQICRSRTFASREHTPLRIDGLAQNGLWDWLGARTQGAALQQ